MERFSTAANALAGSVKIANNVEKAEPLVGSEVAGTLASVVISCPL